jgi:hypothetical protein
MEKDILLDGDFDLQIKDGDFVLGDDLEQRAVQIIRADKGQYKQFPPLGVGIESALNSPLTPQLKREIELQLAADGIKSTIDLTTGDIKFTISG